MKRLLWLLLLAAWIGFGQDTTSTLSTAGRIRRGAVLPVGACVESQVFYVMGVGGGLYVCNSAGAWVLAAGAGGAGGTVSSVGLTGTPNQITVTGTSPVTGSGGWTLSFPPGGVTLPGTTTGTFSGPSSTTTDPAVVRGAGALATTNKVPVVSSTDGSLVEGPMSCDPATGTCTIGTTVSTTGQQIDVLCSGNVTTTLQAAITALAGANGGTVRLSSGSCYSTAQITVPHDAASPPAQNSIRLTGQSRTILNNQALNATDGTILDLRYATTTAKILTLAHGVLEIDHVTFTDTTDGTLPFLYTTFTSVMVHDNQFVGKTPNSTSQDAIVLGGTTNNIVAAAATSAFQGYGTVIERNSFANIQRGVYLRAFANGIVVRDNMWWNTCGGTTAIEIAGLAAGGANYGGLFSGNLIELGNYSYAVTADYAIEFSFITNNFYDSDATTLAYYNFGSNAYWYTIVDGFGDSTIVHQTGAGANSGTRITNAAYGENRFQRPFRDLAAQNFTLQNMATPAAPTVTPTGTDNSVSYGYKIAAYFADGITATAASAETVNTHGATALSASDYMTISWPENTLATTYKIRRNTGGTTQGVIGTIWRNSVTCVAGTCSFVDTGLAASGTLPSVNTTGALVWATDGVSPIGGASGNRPSTIYSYGGVYAGAGSTMGSYGKSVLYSHTNGDFTLFNWANNGFGVLQFGCHDATCGGWKGSGTTLQARVADNSAYASITHKSLNWTNQVEGGCGAQTDFVVDGTLNTKVTSASYNFVAADVGGLFQVTAGTGWTVGDYTIASVAANAATLSSSPAAVGTTGGTATYNHGRQVFVHNATADTFRQCKTVGSTLGWN